MTKLPVQCWLCNDTTYAVAYTAVKEPTTRESLCPKCGRGIIVRLLPRPAEHVTINFKLSETEESVK